jgi:hypothetical protein
MKKIIVGCMLLTLAVVQTATALDVGVFASRWDHKDGDAVWGGGVLFLPASLPMEFRGTFYERSDTGQLQASPLDVGFAFGLTRFESVNISAVVGGSYYLVDAKGYSPDNEFGWYAGGRIEFSVHQDYAVFGEALYRGADLDNADFSGVAFNLGILF